MLVGVVGIYLSIAGLLISPPAPSLNELGLPGINARENGSAAHADGAAPRTRPDGGAA